MMRMRYDELKKREIRFFFLHKINSYKRTRFHSIDCHNELVVHTITTNKQSIPSNRYVFSKNSVQVSLNGLFGVEFCFVN